MTTATKLEQKLEQNQEKAWEYLRKIMGTRYTWWRSGIVPERGPAWGKNGPPPSPDEVREEGCFCAGVATLARRAVGLPVPTLGNPSYDGGVVAYFGSTDSAPAIYARRGFFDVHGRARRFDLEKAKRPWTLIGRKFRNANDQGHVAIVLPGGKVLQSYDQGGGRPGVNADATLEGSHFSWGPQGGYEVMVYAEDWLLPLDHKDLQDDDRKHDRDDHERPRDDEDGRDKQKDERPDRRPGREVPLFTARQLIEIANNPNLAQATAEKYRDALAAEMQKGRIDTYMRAAAFLAEIVQETDRLKAVEEYASGRAYEGRRDLGNVQPGDGSRFKGRGFIMITGRSNYTAASRDLDLDLVSNPGHASRPEVAARVAVWFWNKNGCSPYADRGQFKAVSAIINTGSPHGEPNGMADRLYFYDRARRVLSRDMQGAGGGADPGNLERNGFNRDGLPLINLAAVGQADETVAFALATEIRKAGIGVTVINGRSNVYALAAKMRREDLGYRQLWIIGEPALDACGEYGELANWPISPKTDYYDLAGKDFSGTCRRAAELADEKARQGVGRRFLEEMGSAKTASTKEALPAREPQRDEPEEAYDEREDEEYRRPREARAEEAEYDRNPSGQGARERRREERYGGDSRDKPDGPEPAAGLADADLERIGREVLKLVSNIRNHNGRSEAPWGESEAREEEY